MLLCSNIFLGGLYDYILLFENLTVATVTLLAMVQVEILALPLLDRKPICRIWFLTFDFRLVGSLHVHINIRFNCKQCHLMWAAANIGSTCHFPQVNFTWKSIKNKPAIFDRLFWAKFLYLTILNRHFNSVLKGIVQPGCLISHQGIAFSASEVVSRKIAHLEGVNFPIIIDMHRPNVGTKPKVSFVFAV